MAKPKESTVLVVVDMQPGFTSDKNIIDNVAHLVRGAKRDKVPIVFLELDINSYNKTYPELTKIVSQYKHKKIATKSAEDGSYQVQKFCQSKGIRPKHFVVCGVNFTQCVCATVRGLHNKYKKAKFTVVKDASNSNRYSLHLYDCLERAQLIRLGEKASHG